VIVEEERSEWSLRVNDARDMFLIVMYIYLQVRAGKRTPWSIDNLTRDPLYFGTNTKDRLIGTLSDHEARKVGEELARMGLVRGRAQKTAGDWVPSSADQTIEYVLRGMR
jgi:hypothetical protein